MQGIRHIKRASRRALHAHMAVPALYFAPGDPHGVPCVVRTHRKMDYHGDLAGTSLGTAQRSVDEDALMFDKAQVVPVTRAVVSVEAGEAYAIDHTDPPDDETIRAVVRRLTAQEASVYPVPAGYSDSYLATLDPSLFIPVAQNSSFLHVNLVFPAPHVCLPLTEWDLPLSQIDVIEDNRSGYASAHTLFASDELIPFAAMEQYSFRLDLKMSSSGTDNSVLVRVKNASTGLDFYSVKMALPRDGNPPPSPVMDVSIPFKIYASTDMASDHAKISLEFESGAVVSSAQVYVS